MRRTLCSTLYRRADKSRLSTQSCPERVRWFFVSTPHRNQRIQDSATVRWMFASYAAAAAPEELYGFLSEHWAATDKPFHHQEAPLRGFRSLRRRRWIPEKRFTIKCVARKWVMGKWSVRYINLRHIYMRITAPLMPFAAGLERRGCRLIVLQQNLMVARANNGPEGRKNLYL